MHPIIASFLSPAASGAPLTRREAATLLPLLSSELPDILALARLSASSGGATPFLCGISNAKSGRCAEDCIFCAQSAHYRTNSPVYPLVGDDVLLAKAEELAAFGARYMGVVISGTAPTDRELDKLCDSAARIRAQTDIRLCASLGILRPGQAEALRQAGFTSYHHNLETAASYYAKICTTHGREEREQTVRLARAAGLRVCAGGIFGLGESWEQRLEMSESLAELEVDSIPVNFLNPIQGTPLGEAQRLRPGEALAVSALLRLMHPGRDILICGGRPATLGEWDRLLFSAGVNGLMIGNYLTLQGNPYTRDKAMLEELGLFFPGRAGRTRVD
jgi:biotin synthase